MSIKTCPQKLRADTIGSTVVLCRFQHGFLFLPYKHTFHCIIAEPVISKMGGGEICIHYGTGYICKYRCKWDEVDLTLYETALCEKKYIS